MWIMLCVFDYTTNTPVVGSNAHNYNTESNDSKHGGDLSHVAVDYDLFSTVAKEMSSSWNARLNPQSGELYTGRQLR